MAFLGEFLSDKKTNTSTETLTPNTPEWFKQLIEQNLTGAGNLAQNTDRVAGFTPDQIQAQDAIRGLLGQGDPAYQAAIDSIMGQMTGPNSVLNFGPDSYKPYMNPYQQEVIQGQNAELVRNADIQRNNLRAGSAMRGAFGGAGDILAQSELSRNLNNQISTNTNQGLANAFNWANEMALKAGQSNVANTATLAGSLGNLASGQTNNSLNQINALNASGTQQQQLAQAQKDVPYNNTTWLSGLLSGVNPSSIWGSTGTKTTESEGAGWGSQLIGLATAAAGMASGNPALMAGGANMATGGPGNAGTQVYGDGTSINWTNARPAGFANGGHVKGYADGGWVSDWLSGMVNPLQTIQMAREVPKVSDMRDVPRVSDIRQGVPKTPEIASGVDRNLGFDILERGAAEEPKNRAEFLFKTIPSRVAVGASQTPSFLMDMLAKIGEIESKGLDAAERWLNKPYTQIEAEKAAAEALRQRQEQAPTSSNSNTQSGGPTLLLPPPETTSGAVNQVAQDVVAPMLEEIIPNEIASAGTIPQVQMSEAPVEQTTEPSILDLINQQNATSTRSPSWMDNINLPLLMGGAAMMGSDKPFFGALSEGIKAGGSAIQSQREQEALKANKAQEQTQKLLDSMINAKYKESQIKNAKEGLKIRQQTADSYAKQVEAKSKQQAANKQALDALKTQYNNVAKLLSTAILPEERAKYESQLQQLTSQYNQLSGLNEVLSSGELSPPAELQGNDSTELQDQGNVIDYNELAKRLQK
jgi:hypothetical protein